MAKKVSIKAGHNKNGIKVLRVSVPATGKGNPAPRGRSISQNIQTSRKYISYAISFDGIVESDD